jgi:zinc/manganese transport system ATP-binding protein
MPMVRLSGGEAGERLMVPTRPSGSAPPPIVFDDVAVQRRGRLIWSRATFSIKQGECVAVLGPNGSGKTTLLRVILGQLTPTRGQVTILGAPPQPGNRAIGLVPQRRELVSDLSIRSRDLVLLGINGYRWGFGRARPAELQQMTRALQGVGALDFADEAVGSLSAGQQQRVFIAQALLDDVQLLLLDEPLVSLDLRSQHEIMTLISALHRRRGVTTLIVTHDLNPMLSMIDRVLYILDGHPRCGSIAEVVNAEVLSRLYGTPIRVLRTVDGDLFIRGA